MDRNDAANTYDDQVTQLQQDLDTANEEIGQLTTRAKAAEAEVTRLQSETRTETPASGNPVTPKTADSTESLAAQLYLPQAYIRTWRGLSTQGELKHLTILTLKGGQVGEIVGTSEYPSLKCTGKLTLISGGDDVIVHQNATSTCFDTNLYLSLGEDGKLSFAAHDRDDPSVQATLTGN